jgi:outer membrane lipoprotein LolB
MRRLILLLALGAVLGGCASLHRAGPAAPALLPWDQRLAQLERAVSWELQGRAAVAIGEQGWQASLDWRQSGSESDLHLAGPFNVGALSIKVTPGGVSLNGAPPGDAVVEQLQTRLGFELPLDNLRYWLLGIPNPAAPFELKRNAEDRAQHLAQGGWDIDYDRYLPSGSDALPGRLVLTRADARVRVIVDRWGAPP